MYRSTSWDMARGEVVRGKWTGSGMGRCRVNILEREECFERLARRMERSLAVGSLGFCRRVIREEA